jgi:Mrp family chromosome partitioning ATPase
MKNLSEEVERSEAELGDAETALAEQRARVASLEHSLNEEDKMASKDRSPKYSDHVLEVRKAQPASPAEAAPMADAAAPESAGAKAGLIEINQFQSILAKLYELKSSDLKLADKWAPTSTVMRQHKEQIAKLEAEEKDMLKKYPQLGMVARQANANTGSHIDIVAERAQLEALEAKAGKLREGLNQTRKRVADLTQLAPKIVEKERMRDIEEINYRYMGSSLEKAQIDEALDGSKIPNISIVQDATPPVVDIKKRLQIAGGIAVGIPALAMGATLLFGLILNKTVKRAQEVESRLGIPLVLSIPFFTGRNGKRLRGAKVALAERSEAKRADSAPWDKDHFIVPYAEAIRDRLHAFFERQGVTAKPKLIGVSSFSRGSGTSTLAAGLASALSATDGDRVMLVDMNGAGAATRSFAGGKPADLKMDDKTLAGAEDDSDSERLAVGPVESLTTGAGTLGLSECRRLMGELKTRDCDYLVFDMPPVSDISPSASIGGLMDHVLAVVESDATMTDQVKRGYRDLAAAHATVSIVFNKARGYGSEMFAGA